MKRLVMLALIAAMLMLPVPTLPMDGQLWSTLSDDLKVGYAGGFWEAMIFFEPSQRPPTTDPDLPLRSMHWYLSQCMRKKGINIRQLTEMIDSYVRNHPDEAKYKMAVTVSNALDEACAR